MNRIALIFQSLPREMLEMILLKSMVGFMSVEWMANVRDNESLSRSFHLYETVANKTWTSANISLKSVAYQWMHTRYLNKGVVLKRCELNSQKCFFRIFGNLYSVCILDSVIWGTTYLGINKMHFLFVVCFGFFWWWGGNLGLWALFPPENSWNSDIYYTVIIHIRSFIIYNYYDVCTTSNAMPYSGLLNHLNDCVLHFNS